MDEVLGPASSNEKVDAYQATVVGTIERFFSLKTSRKKMTGMPWLDKKDLKDDKEKKSYLCGRQWETYRGMATTEEDHGGEDQDQEERLHGHSVGSYPGRGRKQDVFTSMLKNFGQYERPKMFNVRDLLPGMRDMDVAEELAAYFNRVSDEFDSLQDSVYGLQTSARTTGIRGGKTNQEVQEAEVNGKRRSLPQTYDPACGFSGHSSNGHL